jgi:2-polyprenyl-3-methyl-5-hydroxy-6-metoxy-1,4-benzoquinol methylase
MSSSSSSAKLDENLIESTVPTTASLASGARCPLCGSENTQQKKVIDLKPFVVLWEKFYGIDIKPELRGVAEVELRRCVRCMVSFFLPDIAGSGAMYAGLEKLESYYAARKWEYEVALRDLAGRKKILEIGCGSGKFIAMAKSEAGLSVEGLEENEQAIEEARAKGLSVRRAKLDDLSESSAASYDAICSFQVIEHIPTLRDFVNACCSLLRPGGLFIAAMPNQRSYIRYMVNPLDMPPHHMTRWTRSTLLRLQRFFPLRVLHTGYEPLPEDQIQLCVDTYDSALRRHGLAFLLHPWLRTRAITGIQKLKLNRFMRGQNMYACYVRL